MKTDSKLLRIVQVTRGKNHPYKLEYVVTLINALSKVKCSIEYLDVVVIVTKDNIKDFRVPSVSGDLNLKVHLDFKTKQKWNKNHIRILGFLPIES